MVSRDHDGLIRCLKRDHCDDALSAMTGPVRVIVHPQCSLLPLREQTLCYLLRLPTPRL